MIDQTIEALENNKLHEAVLRISQFDISQLQSLLINILLEDFKKISNKKKHEDVEYRYDFPDAYSMTFRLHKEKKKWYMSIYFNYDDLFYLHVIDGHNVIVPDNFAEITLEKETRSEIWALYCIINKENIYNIIKNV